MKKILWTFLIFLAMIPSLGFNTNAKVKFGKSMEMYAAPIIECFSYGGTYYNVHCIYPDALDIRRISMNNGWYIGINPPLGNFYLNANNVLCVNTSFNGPYGFVFYDGVLNVGNSCP